VQQQEVEQEEEGQSEWRPASTSSLQDLLSRGATNIVDAVAINDIQLPQL